MKKVNKKYLSYKDYLITLSKEELLSFLKLYNINCKKNYSKEKLISLIFDNLSNIVQNIVENFQLDEYICYKYLEKKKGIVTIRINHLLEYFIKNLVNNKLMVKVNSKNYYMPSDLLQEFKKQVKKHKKSFFEKNTQKYNLILGFLDAYGVIEFNDFYDLFTKDYKLKKEEVLLNLSFLAKFYNEFKIIKEKDKTFISNIIIEEKKTYKSFVYDNKKCAIYTNNEIKAIHDLSYLKKFKSYKKFSHYLKEMYFIEKNNIKVINKYVLVPFLNYNELNKEKAKVILESLIDKYFEETKNSKEKLIEYIIDVSHDYPRWELSGYSERDKVC